MADTNTTQPANDDASKKKLGSPWDEELPPEEPKTAKVVGSLDARMSDLSTNGGNKKPVPFNIPTDVNDEKVGKKIPAENVINSSQQLAPVPEAKTQAVSQVAKPASNIQPRQTATPIAKATPPKIAPGVKSEPVQAPAPFNVQNTDVQKTNNLTNDSIPNKAESKVETPAIKPQTAKPNKSLQNNAPTPSGLATVTPVQPTNPKPKTAGVNELIMPKTDLAEPETDIFAAQPTTIPPVKLNEPINKPEISQPKPVLEKVPISPAPVAKLQPESAAMADIKPKARVEKEPPTPILPNISKPITLPEEENVDQVKPVRPIRETTKIPGNKNREFLDIAKPVQSNKVPFYKKAKFLIPVIAIFFFVLGVYLTEAGVLSIGLEKVYGLTGIEALWGGLPRNPERALGMSVSAMQNQLNFKVKGTISMTVNKTIKSQITSPLVSMSNLPYAMRDTNEVSGIAAVTTQYDYYGDDTSSSTTTDSYSTDTSQDTATSTSQDSSTFDTSTSILGDQSEQSSYQVEESTIKQIDADIEGKSSDQAIETDFIIKKLVGASSSVDLIATKSQLFVKSSPDIQFAPNAEDSKWLEFNVVNVQNENPFKDFASIKLDQGFSIIGQRSGNEKIGNTRCYKYTIDNLEIGDSLSFLGINKDMVQKIEGNIWIGVADHYLHKVDLKIIPSISSSISQMSVTFEMFDFGVENSITIPALQDKVVANVLVNPSTTETSTSETTTTPTVASAVTMAERDQTRKNDLQSIKTALEKYKSTNGKFPIANTMIHLNTADNVVQKALVPEYISALPTDPKAADGWYFGYKSNGSTFTLSARLENPADPQVTRVGDAYIHWVYNN